MLANYILIAFRYLRKNKLFTVINIFGLTIGVTCALSIFLFVKHELSYDAHYPHNERIYRVIQGGTDAEQSSSLPFPSGPTLQNDFGDMIETNVRLFNFQASTLAVVYEPGNERKTFNEPRFFFADSTFFKVFEFPFVKGNPLTALNGPNLIVVTESTAQRYFGEEEPIGKILRFEGKYDMTVTGVVKDIPENTHFHFDFLASFSSLQQMFDNGIPEKNWYWNPVWTYVLLKEGENPERLNGQLKTFVNKYYHPSLRDETELVLQPVTDIYLKSTSEYEIGVMSDIRYVYIFSLISMAVLLIACVNFINLTTAHSAERFKEIGMRKVMGAKRGNLIFQFVTESMVITLVSSFSGVALTALMIPFLNQLTGKSLSIMTLLQPTYMMQFGIGVVLLGLISGIYPAFILSRYQAAQVLKPNTGKFSGNILLRKSLVVFQFVISLIFVSGSLIAYRQIDYMRTAKLGFEGDQILMLPVQRLSIVPKYESFKEVLLTNTNISSVTTANVIVGRDYQSSNYKKEGDDDMTLYPCLYVRNDFATTMGVNLLAGSDFTSEVTAPEFHAIINQSFAKTFGWENPEDAIGQIIDGTLEGKIRITGVSDDFHFASLKQAIGPMIMIRCDYAKSRDFFTRFVMVRIKSTDLQETLDFINAQWKGFVTESPFDYFFLDDDLNKLYKAEEKFTVISSVFSIIAICIGTLGLFGLASFAVRKRRKEISIRRILGASVNTILTLLTWDFGVLILISAILGIPLSWLLMNEWLNGFAFHVEIGVLGFMMSVGTILIITLATISFITLKATRANPVDSLRTE